MFLLILKSKNGELGQEVVRSGASYKPDATDRIEFVPAFCVTGWVWVDSKILRDIFSSEAKKSNRKVY